MKEIFSAVSAVLVLIGYATAASVGKLPSNFDICQRGPKFNSCLEKAVDNALRALVKGYPPLGLYSIDPLLISRIEIDQGSGPVSVNLKFKDLKIAGLSGLKSSNFKSNMDDLRFTANVTIPKINLEGPYSVNGKVLVLPINGDGLSKLSLTDVTGAYDIHATKFKKDGKTYARVTKFDFNFETKKLVINLTNLFNGDKALGDNMNKFLNENSADIVQELKPAVQLAFGTAFSEISNRIFTKVPLDDIFPK